MGFVSRFPKMVLCCSNSLQAKWTEHYQSKFQSTLFWYMNSFIGQVHGDSFPCFLRSLLFPSYIRDFHSLARMIRGSSYLGFLSWWTLYWSQTIFICCPTFFRTMALLNVSLSNMPTNQLLRSYFKF